MSDLAHQPPVEDDVVIAVDPGRAKCGIAAVGKRSGAICRLVSSAADAPDHAARLASQYGALSVVIGNGTGSREMAQRVSAAVRPLEVVLVQEHRTSELARARYLAEHPPRGWRRLIPRGLRTPDEPYDDLVAVILGENWWAATCEQPNRC